MWQHLRLALIIAVLIIARLEISRSQKPRLGGAINIFNRYGHLTISMRVVSRNDTGTWIFREPTVDVFHNLLPAPPKQSKSTTVFHGDFHMEFCDNVRQLQQAYFRDFTIENIERPWRAFTSSWTPNVMAKHLGINSSYIYSDHCFVLVRVSRFRENQELMGNMETLVLNEDVENEANTISIGDKDSVLYFVRNFGSHYIKSFVTGNSLYQVFVYRPEVYLQIKERLKTRGVADLSNLELSNYFSPWYAEHMGRIQSASGNHTVEDWAKKQLEVQYFIFTYSSLLKLHGDIDLLRQLNILLGNEALLQLQLRALLPLFKDTKLKEWFLEVMDNYSKLWEVNE